MMPPRKRQATRLPIVVRSTPNWLTNGATVLAILTLLSLAIFAYKRTLLPLYALGPSQYLLNKIIFATIALSSIPLFNLSIDNALLLTGLLLSTTPTTSYWAAVLTARMRDPLWGPALTHIFVISPIVYLFASLIMNSDLNSLPRLNTSPLISTVQDRLVRVGVSCFLTTQILNRVWASSFLNFISDDAILFCLAWIVLGIWIARYFLALSTHPPPVLVFLVMGLLLSLTLQSRYSSLSQRLPYTHSSYPLRILSSTQSLTGLIVVGEGVLHPDAKDAFRYLRASHSILGGVWAGKAVKMFGNTPVVDEHSTTLGDSIYSAFVLQEAARLVNSTGKSKWENVLVIGLGTGVSASAFIQHNLSTTVIEIDPAVYDAARTFFGMPYPGPENIFLEDGRGWIERIQTTPGTNKEALFDIVVHDCFSGGGVPKHLFTLEFWESLKSLMHKDAVLAVNFAGIPGSEASRAILATLEQSFPQCRAFHDLFGDLPKEKYSAEFVNVVFFCTISSRPLTFRQDHEADHLGSPLRKHILSSLPAREIDTTLVRQEGKRGQAPILTDRHNPLDEWQEGQMFEHWKLMRQVFPDVFWETY